MTKIRPTTLAIVPGKYHIGVALHSDSVSLYRRIARVGVSPAELSELVEAFHKGIDIHVVLYADDISGTESEAIRYAAVTCEVTELARSRKVVLTSEQLRSAADHPVIMACVLAMNERSDAAKGIAA